MTRCLAATVTSLSLFLSFALPNWPEFRGPTGMGLADIKDPPTEWSPTKNVVWKQPIPGLGWSSPIILGKRIYLTTAVPQKKGSQEDQSLRALALDIDSGKILWNVEVFLQNGATSPRIHRKNSHASPTPLSDGQRLYVHFGHQGTACLDLQGKILWRNTDFKYQPVHGNGGSPVLFENLLIFSIDGSDKQLIVALDKTTGKERWRTPRKSEAVKRFSFGTPLVINTSSGPQLISPGSDVVVSLNPRDGKELWRCRYSGYSVVPRPVYGHGLVFIATGYDEPGLIAVKVDGKGDVTDSHIAWRTDRGAPLNPSPLLVGDELYLVSDNGIASCLEARTGKVHWRERLGGNFSASPLSAAGYVYFQDEEGIGAVVRAGKEFQKVGKNDLGERTLASYACAERAFFIRTEKHVYRIQKE